MPFRRAAQSRTNRCCRAVARLVPSAHDREGKWCWPAGVGKKRRKQVVQFVGDAIELVAESVVQCKVGKNLERVLGKSIEILLAESTEIIGGTVASLAKELRLGHRSHSAEERPHHVLKRWI